MPSGDRQHSSNKISVLGERRQAPARLLGCNKMCAAAAPEAGDKPHFSFAPEPCVTITGLAANHSTLHHDDCRLPGDPGRRARRPRASPRAAAGPRQTPGAGQRLVAAGRQACRLSIERMVRQEPRVRGCADAHSGRPRPAESTPIQALGTRTRPAPRSTGRAGEGEKLPGRRAPLDSADRGAKRLDAAPLLAGCRLWCH